MAVQLVGNNKLVLDTRGENTPGTFTASAFSVSIWSKCAVSGAAWTKGTAFYGSPPRSCSFGLYTNTSGEGCRFAIGDYTGASNEDDVGGGTASTAWNHLAGTVGGGNMYAWFNGTQVGTRATGFTLTHGIASYSGDENAQMAGHFDDRFYYYGGDLAEAAFWDCQLSAGEIAALARGVSPWMIRIQSLKTYVPFLGPEQYVYATDRWGYREWGPLKHYWRERLTSATSELSGYHAPVGRLVP